MTETTDPLSGALWAASRGFHVFAVDHPALDRCAGLKTGHHDPSTCTERGKHPAERFTKTGTTDAHEIAARFSGRTRNFGVYCADSGLLVADDDTGDALADYAESIGETIPQTITVITARGLHYYFAAPAGMKLSNETGNLPDKIDVRAGNAYVVGPGSMHASGSTYHLLDPNAPLAPAPDWLIRAITAKSTPEPFTAPDNAHTGTIPKGKRHQELVKYAVRLRHRHLDVDEAITLTKLRWRDCEQPEGDTYPEDRVEPLVRDIFTRYTPEQAPDVGMFDMEVAAEAHRLRVRDAAREVVRAESLPPAPEMDMVLLDDIEDESVRYRIDKTLPMNGNLLVVAKRKAGKSTILLNLIRALRTGEPFLGSLEVEPITGRVAYLNYELPRAMFQAWAHDVGLTSDDMLAVNLRGRRNPLGNDQDLDTLRAGLVEHKVEVIVVDPFSRAFTGQNINDTGEVTRFLADLDILKTEVGASSLIVAAHAGWGADRARNSSVLEDWPDAIITMTADDQHRRYLSAIGRDVELDEDQLVFDPHTRALTLSGAGNRQVATTADRLNALADTITEIASTTPGLTTGEIEARLKDLEVGIQKGDVSKAASLAEGSKRITRRKEGRSVRHYPSDIPRHAPTYPAGAYDVPRPLYRGGVRPGHIEDDMPRATNLITTALGGEVIA